MRDNFFVGMIFIRRWCGLGEITFFFLARFGFFGITLGILHSKIDLMLWFRMLLVLALFLGNQRIALHVLHAIGVVGFQEHLTFDLIRDVAIHFFELKRRRVRLAIRLSNLLDLLFHVRGNIEGDENQLIRVEENDIRLRVFAEIRLHFVLDLQFDSIECH